MNENVTPTVTDEREGGTSASNALPDSLCKGRHLAQKGLPDQSSDDAKFGNEIHAALALGNPSQLSTEQLSIYESMEEITQSLMDRVFGADWPKAKVFKERRFRVAVADKPADSHILRYKHSGKPDFVARLGSKALVVEYKCLPGEVAEAPTNMQLRDQAVLVAGELLCNEVYTAVNQPLVTHTSDLCLYNKEALKQAEQEMFVRVRESNNEKSKRTAGEKQCQFCLARVNCPQYQEFAQSLIPAPASMFGVSPREWSDEQRAKFMDGKRVAQKWLDETYDELKKLIVEFPSSVPGYALTEGDKVRTITDPQELFRRFSGLGTDWAVQNNADLLGIFMKCMRVNKTELEASVRTVTGFKGKKLVAALKAMEDGIVVETKKAGSLEKVKA
jgi:hypothetical protein